MMSNKEAVEIVYSAKNKEKSARRLVECAALAWKVKKKGIAMDDISAICLFFHSFQANGPMISQFSSLVTKSI